MEEWINAARSSASRPRVHLASMRVVSFSTLSHLRCSAQVTLSLNAEMEKERVERERLMEELEKVCEGEDLDAIDAALAKAEEAGAPRALARWTRQSPGLHVEER